MELVRRTWTVLVAAWFGAWAGRGLCDWVLALDRGWVLAGALAGTVAGGLVGLRQAREVAPLPPEERRDAVLGWGALTGAVAMVACLFLPLPWSVLGVALVAALMLVGLRRAARGAPGSASRSPSAA